MYTDIGSIVRLTPHAWELAVRPRIRLQLIGGPGQWLCLGGECGTPVKVAGPNHPRLNVYTGPNVCGMGSGNVWGGKWGLVGAWGQMGWWLGAYSGVGGGQNLSNVGVWGNNSLPGNRPMGPAMSGCLGI